MIAVGNDRQWASCCAALELDELRSDSQLATNAGRLAHRDCVTTTMVRRVAERAADEWLARLSKVGVPSGRVRLVSEALQDVPHSPLTGIAPSIPGSIRFPPPKLNEHGAEIRRLGWGVFNPLGGRGNGG